MIIPAHTFTSSAYPFLKHPVRVIWADIDLDTRVTSAEIIEPLLTDRTRAIVVPHLYGFGVDVSQIVELVNNRDILVVEDAAQALGVSIDGEKAGSIGDMGVMSFHSHKNISTLGEGGMLCVRDKAFAEVIPMIRNNGHCAYTEERRDYWIPAMGNVDMPQLSGRSIFPNNYCLGEVECALGSKLLERIDQINNEKRARALRFMDAFVEYPELKFHRVETTRHNYHLLAARVRTGMRDPFIRKMAHEHGIQCVVQYYPLYRYPYYEKIGFGSASCPNTDLFFDNMVSFPFHHSLAESDFQLIIDSARTVLDELRSEW